MSLSQAAASKDTHNVAPEVPQTVADTEERYQKDDSEKIGEKSLDDEILETGRHRESEVD